MKTQCTHVGAVLDVTYYNDVEVYHQKRMTESPIEKVRKFLHRIYWGMQIDTKKSK